MKRGYGAVLVSVLAIALASCAEDETGTPTFHPASGLSAAMSSVSGADGAGDYVEYGDIKKLRELGAIADDHRIVPEWQRAVGYGASALFRGGYALEDKIGISPLAFDTAITIGQPPDTAMRLTGVDAAAFEKGLTELGAEPRTFAGKEGVSLGGDNEIDVDSPLAEIGIVNQLNQVLSLDAETIVASPNADGIEAAASTGETSLYDTEPYGDVADCMGDVVAAAIVTLDEHPTTSVVGVGIRTPNDLDDAGNEVLCAAPAEGKEKAVEDALTDRMSLEATSLVTSSKLTEYLSATGVTTSHGCVQATAMLKDEVPVGFLLSALQNREVEYWLGGPRPR